MTERVFKNIKNVMKLTQEFNSEFKVKAFIKDSNYHTSQSTM